jgi:hypothetical protein
MSYHRNVSLVGPVLTFVRLRPSLLVRQFTRSILTLALTVGPVLMFVRQKPLAPRDQGLH